ncbi:MAG TPA: FAD-dependent oxidoreductase [Acidothermaceae bacterium]|nr:FAD-dependent oxidoreductase [Acidothermaceae bacterium]
MDYDLVVVGGGAGGMAAARAAARLHRRVALVQDGAVGGDCTFTGCVPSKTLIEAAAAGVDFAAAMLRVHETVGRIAATETADVLRGEGIDVVQARARFTGPRVLDAGGRRLSAGKVVIATGSSPMIPPIPGLADVSFLTNETVWDLTQRPASMAVLGGGAIGCELAQAFARFGVHVTIVEAQDRLLGKEEPQASATVAAVFKREGIEVRLGAKVVGVARVSGGVRLMLDDGSLVEAERVLVAVGRRPVTDGLDVEAAGVRVDDRGYIRADDFLRTSARGVYAVGDVNGKLPFTHAADEMGRLAAINALRAPLRLRFHAETTPWVTFTHPEVARVGMTQAQAARHGGRVAFLPMSEVDRAIAADQTDGFVQLIAGPRTLTRNLGGGRLLGATIVAPRAGEMIHEVALAMRVGAFTGRLAQTVHAYPTWSTAIRSTAAQFFFDVGGRRATAAREQG